MKKYIWILAVVVLALTSCSKEENPVNNSGGPSELVGSWICQYDEDGIDVFGDPYDHVVKYYCFFDDGAGFYELYYFKDNRLSWMEYGRGDYGEFEFTAKDGKVWATLYELDFDTYEYYETTWTLGYAENRLVDQDGYLYRHATEKEDQQTLGWFSSQHIAGEDDEAITTPVNEGYTDEPARARQR